MFRIRGTYRQHLKPAKPGVHQEKTDGPKSAELCFFLIALPVDGNSIPEWFTAIPARLVFGTGGFEVLPCIRSSL